MVAVDRLDAIVDGACGRGFFSSVLPDALNDEAFNLMLLADLLRHWRAGHRTAE
jgi:hypothetical protein